MSNSKSINLFLTAAALILFGCNKLTDVVKPTSATAPIDKNVTAPQDTTPAKTDTVLFRDFAIDKTLAGNYFSSEFLPQDIIAAGGNANKFVGKPDTTGKLVAEIHIEDKPDLLSPQGDGSVRNVFYGKQYTGSYNDPQASVTTVLSKTDKTPFVEIISQNATTGKFDTVKAARLAIRTTENANFDLGQQAALNKGDILKINLKSSNISPQWKQNGKQYILFGL